MSRFYNKESAENSIKRLFRKDPHITPTGSARNSDRMSAQSINGSPHKEPPQPQAKLST
jgi:hypothetical protein